MIKVRVAEIAGLLAAGAVCAGVTLCCTDQQPGEVSPPHALS
jgi:hypothetical protein